MWPSLRCINCHAPAFYRRIYEGTTFCKACFREDIEEKIRRTITKYDLLRFDDHLAVAVSGGKDSLALLTMLKKIERRFPHAKITAITVDEGIDGYRAESMWLAQKTCRDLNVDHHKVGFQDLFGQTLDEIVKTHRELTPCSYCGVLRRRALQVAARDVGASKIATGHNLDDEAQTLLLNIFHGDVARIIRSGTILEGRNCGFLPRIKPASEILEQELALYAYTSGIEFQTTPCPYLAPALRNDMRQMLNKLEVKHPGTKFTVLRSIERIRSSMDKASFKTNYDHCSKCGEPSSGDFCEVCRILNKPPLPVPNE